MATISTSQNINAVTYAAGEALDITSGAVLTIDAQVPADVAKLSTNPGNINCLTSGKLRVVNTSNTTAIVVRLNSNANDFRFEKNGIIEVRGNYIEAGTGNGGTQTFDLSAFPSGYWPSVVQVETASGSGVFIPWPLICTAGATVTHATTEFGANEDGKVMFYNATTRIMTCGNGTNGVPVPNGAKVRVANICFTAATNNATPTARTLIDCSPTGTIDAEWLSLSNAIFFSMSGHGQQRFVNCGITGGWQAANTNSPVSFDGFQVNPDTEQTTVATTFSAAAINGDFSVSRLSVFTGGLVTGGGKVTLSQLFSVVGDMDYLFCARKNGTTTAGDETLLMQSLFKKDGSRLVLDNITVIGRTELTNLANVDFVNLKIAGAHGTTLSTAQTSAGIVLTNAQSIKIVGMAHASASPNFNTQILSADGQSSDIAVYNMVFDANNGPTGFIASGNGGNVRFYNSTLTNCRTGSVMLDAPTTYLQSSNAIYNCRATMFSGTQTTDGGKGAAHNLSPSTGAGLNTSMAGGDTYAFANLCDLGASPTTGSVVCGPFGAYSGLVFTGTGQLDQAGGIELPTNADTFEVETIFPLVGVTSFQNASPTYTYTQDVAGVATLFTDSATAPNNVTFEFRVKNPGGTYGSYQSLTGANLSGALAALSGYDSDVGFHMQIKATATATDVFRIINQVFVSTNIDNTYVYPDATITFNGPNPTDVVKVRRVSDMSLLYTFTGSGTKSFTVGANFGVEICVDREDSGGTVLMRSNPQTYILTTGNNGEIDLFYGAEIQLAESADVAAIKAAVDAYLDATISSRLPSASYTAPDNASISAILTDTSTTIPAQISALNDFNPATDAVTVGAINNNVITSSTIANNALDNSAFTTGYFNSINSEVDTAISDANLSTFNNATDTVISNIKYVNNIEVKGTGTTSDPWNPV